MRNITFVCCYKTVNGVCLQMLECMGNRSKRRYLGLHPFNPSALVLAHPTPEPELRDEGQSKAQMRMGGTQIVADFDESHEA